MKRKAVLCISVLLFILVVAMSGCGYHWQDFETYAQWLKEDDDFDSAESLELDEPYIIGSQVCTSIAEKYNIEEIAGNGTTQEKTLNVLKWVSDNIIHDGSQMVNLDKFNGYTLLEYGFGTEKGMNCYCLGVVMTACIQALGIKARTVFLMPKEYNTGDNHVVTHVYLDEEERWIMVDPSWNAYFSNEDGAIMNVFELRDAFANGTVASLNLGANHNGDVADESYYKMYMAKNLYWFQITLYSDTYNCYPNSFDLNKWYANRLKWYIKEGFTKVDNEEEEIEQIMQHEYKNLNKADFLKP